MASYPFLVALLTKNDLRGFDDTLRTALHNGLGLLLPCALWMTAAAWPVVATIFQGGRFGPAEVAAATPLTQLLLTPTPFWLLYMVLVRAYYAHGDTITPAVTGTIVTLCCLPVYYYWAVPLGARAIAAVSGVSVSCYVLWLVGIWWRRHGGGAFVGLPMLVGKTLACCLPAGAIAWYVGQCIMKVGPLPPLLTACAALAASGLAFALCFLPLAWFAVPVWHSLLQRLCGRLGRC